MTSTLKITFHAGAVPKDDLGGDLLSSSGLVTSSEEYYPTVAINALMRALRDPAMASHHAQVVRSLFSIFQGLRLAAVPFLPKASILFPSGFVTDFQRISRFCHSRRMSCSDGHQLPGGSC